MSLSSPSAGGCVGLGSGRTGIDEAVWGRKALPPMGVRGLRWRSRLISRYEPGTGQPKRHEETARIAKLRVNLRVTSFRPNSLTICDVRAVSTQSTYKRCPFRRSTIVVKVLVTRVKTPQEKNARGSEGCCTSIDASRSRSSRRLAKGKKQSASSAKYADRRFGFSVALCHRECSLPFLISLSLQRSRDPQMTQLSWSQGSMRRTWSNPEPRGVAIHRQKHDHRHSNAARLRRAMGCTGTKPLKCQTQNAVEAETRPARGWR